MTQGSRYFVIKRTATGLGLFAVEQFPAGKRMDASIASLSCIFLKFRLDTVRSVPLNSIYKASQEKSTDLYRSGADAAVCILS